MEKTEDIFRTLKMNYPDRVPVCLKRVKSSDPEIKRHNFLVPSEITFSKFICTIRGYYEKLDPSVGMYYFVGEEDRVFPSTYWTMGELFSKYNVNDRYLVIKYTMESSFG